MILMPLLLAAMIIIPNQKPNNYTPEKQYIKYKQKKKR